MLSCQKTVAARPVGDSKVEVVFGNGQKDVFDCAYLLNYEMSSALSDILIFNQSKAEHGTLTWPNDIDVASEEVWERIIKIMQQIAATIK